MNGKTSKIIIVLTLALIASPAFGASWEAHTDFSETWDNPSDPMPNASKNPNGPWAYFDGAGSLLVPSADIPDSGQSGWQVNGSSEGDYGLFRAGWQDHTAGITGHGPSLVKFTVPATVTEPFLEVSGVIQQADWELSRQMTIHISKVGCSPVVDGIATPDRIIRSFGPEYLEVAPGDVIEITLAGDGPDGDGNNTFVSWDVTFTEAAEAQEPEYVFPTPGGQIKIVCWNIEFLGWRTPLRTQAQINMLADRISTFDAAVLALQEITDGSILTDISCQLGSSWQTYHTGADNALLYDEAKVEMLSVEMMDSLSNPPYTNYPGDWWRRPVSGVFRPIGGTKSFRVIGIHCHWNDAAIRAQEGTWLRSKIIELLEDPGETHEIFLIGDFNGNPPSGSPHPQLLIGDELSLLPKENGDVTSTLGIGKIDWFYVTQPVIQKLRKFSTFVIRPEHYGETPVEFEATYSDHLPVFSNIYSVIQNVDGPVENVTKAIRYDYIQHAIIDAQPGDEIVTEPGIYYENINFAGKNITLTSIDPDDPNVVARTVIRADGMDSVVTFAGTENNSCVLIGFTITTNWPEEDFLAHWELDDDSGLTAYDSIGGHDGTLTNFAGDDSQWVPGQVNGALEFDGIDEYVDVVGYKGVTGMDSRTCAAWIKTTGTGAIVSWGDSDISGGWWLFWVEDDGRLRLNCQGGAIVGSTDLRDNNWHHVVAVLKDDGTPDNSEVKLYVDGAEETYSSITSQPIDTTSHSNVTIGASYLHDGTVVVPFIGRIDDVRIYNRRLSENEIKLLAQDYTWYGGGVLGNGTSAEISKCVIKNNAVQNHGGGLFDFDGKIDKCIITGNRAPLGAGGGLAACQGIISNCLIYGNSSKWSGGLNNCDNQIINCTIADNTATVDGGGLSGIDGIIANCIIWGNVPNQFFISTAVPDYSCIQDYSGGGQGNINNDPCFVDAFNADFHLQSQAGRWDPNTESWVTDAVTSPCIDAGNPGCLLGDEPTDMTNLRINMGAYGGTAEASKTPAIWSLLADLTNDGIVNLPDFANQAIDWQNTAAEQPGDLNRNGTVDLNDALLMANDWLHTTTWH